ncbi:PilZ domain-containing protein [Sphingomicrobium arenosum]|uniref:PilZ domain-containing protein n=1 Tax=Sphingomicrobium arenosum TaxID=2233861 RepID=UPI00223EC659|nr:PilZ domain-containing protein [Sphingomicrobium arenosum]
MAERDPDFSRAVRIDLSQRGVLTDCDGGRVAVIVRDLSKDGCKLDTDGSLEMGEAVSLQVGKGPAIPAVVAWTRDLEVGLQFSAASAIG